MSCRIPQIKRLQSAEVLARIVGWENTPIVPTDISTITYSAFYFREATGVEVAITAYQDVAITPAATYLEETPILDSKWDEDEIGYNFHYILPAALFAERDMYLIRVTFTPVDVSLQPLSAIYYIEVE
jgi:hypothetical protein